MKKICFLIFMLLVGAQSAIKAQFYIPYNANEAYFSLGIGPGYLYGDAAAQNVSSTDHTLTDFAPVNIGLSISLDYTKYWTPGLSYDISLLYSHFKGNENQSHLSYRGYAFESHLGELSAKIQFGPLSFIEKESMLLDPYFILGAGIVGAYVPSWSFAKDTNRPDGTDHLKHSILGLSMIGGVGLKFPISPSLTGRLELTLHPTTTDYLDGFHPKSSKNNDFFVVGLVKISYQLFKYQNERYD
ncbi:DUF6089 family protein [Microbacter margulisiae]|uniref:DUF6089 domain-containing protein n=1 Tax=Microbacter margulisiae TaxID=1350067 RepID=A0A7W5H2P9_9PORP|nr:DUF6089 family protein [Microbacter margulisiae]MBB3188015.1 hypothetical protein [Microbacter margulisiae]